MIYIDQPTQVGFSYSVPTNGYIDPTSGFFVSLPDDTCPDYAQGSCATLSNGNISETAHSTTSAAPNVWRTLQGFMGAFPQYAPERGIPVHGVLWRPLWSSVWRLHESSLIALGLTCYIQLCRIL